jgi:hypothetical protein
MAFLAGGALAVAVSRAGGLGVIGGGYGDADWLDAQFTLASDTPEGCGFIVFASPKSRTFWTPPCRTCSTDIGYPGTSSRRKRLSLEKRVQSPRVRESGDKSSISKEATMKVSEIMTRDVEVANPDHSIQAVARLMADKEIGSCPSARMISLSEA